MESRTFCFIAVFLVGWSAFAFVALATPVAVTEAPLTEEQKILLDCRNSDYRTYIKCLKRQKRHHLHHGDGYADSDGHCMETCLKQCEPEHDCDKKCSHCLKRTKHKHQIITEYESECTSGNCESNNSGLSTTNITTNIDINNVINNCGPNVPGGPSSCGPGKNGSDYPCQPPGPCHPPSFPSWPIVPQLTLVPQITFGLGLGPIGGCSYPFQWPCVQQYPHPRPPPNIDCSGCGNPFLRYRCDVSCYTVQGTQSTDYGHAGNVNAGTTCQSPYCVGGSQQT